VFENERSEMKIRRIIKEYWKPVVAIIAVLFFYWVFVQKYPVCFELGESSEIFPSEAMSVLGIGTSMGLGNETTVREST
jgi:hypothetical protein